MEPDNRKHTDVANRGDGAGNASISMHDNVPVWYDCCSCEAEPYWVEALSQTHPGVDAAGNDATDETGLSASATN